MPEPIVPEFIDRINNPEKYPAIRNKDGSVSTHKMAAEVDAKGNWYAFPTIVMLPTGKLYEFKDNQTAMDYALRTGNFLPMKNQEEAIKYAEGGYKTEKMLKYDEKFGNPKTQ